MKRKSKFLERIRFKYRVSILNENTLEEAWYTRLSRVSVFLWVCTLIVLTFSLLALFILFTPIKHYLPGYGDTSMRGLLLNEALRIDSVQHELKLQEEYLSILRNILSGEVQNDTIKSLDTLAMIERERIAIEKSQIEADFQAQFEEKERYNLTLFEGKQEVLTYVFFKPTNGVVTSSFSAEEKRFGISLSTSPNENVVSVLAGTVLYVSLSFDYEWVMIIQHDNDYISIYKHNSRVFKKVGDLVRGGESIAIVGNTSENEPGREFYFELWKKGTPINPEDVIAF